MVVSLLLLLLRTIDGRDAVGRGIVAGLGSATTSLGGWQRLRGGRRGVRQWAALRLLLPGCGGRAGHGPHVPHLVGQLVHQDPVTKRGFADVGTRTAVHGEAVAALAHDLDGTAVRAGLFGQDGGEAGGVRAADGDTGAQTGAGEDRGLLVGDDSAPFQRDDVVGGTRGLLGVPRAEQNGAALGGVGAQHAVEPAGLAGGERAGGVVEDQGVRVGK